MDEGTTAPKPGESLYRIIEKAAHLAYPIEVVKWSETDQEWLHHGACLNRGNAERAIRAWQEMDLGLWKNLDVAETIARTGEEVRLRQHDSGLWVVEAKSPVIRDWIVLSERPTRADAQDDYIAFAQ
jgi:hypothetical protein